MNLVLQGRKVVVVDLDLETPGLGTAMNLTPFPQYGISSSQLFLSSCLIKINKTFQ